MRVRRVLVFIFIPTLFLFLPKNILAQVVINEFSSATSDQDWIELYNTSNSEIDLKGWLIKDTASTPLYEFTTSNIIPAYGFCVKDVSNRLNNSGDRIKLFQGTIERDCVAYGNGNGSFCGSAADIDAPSGELVAARRPDGTGVWMFGSATYGYSNTASSEPESKVLCYIPSSLTPTPTSAISPTPVTGTYKINEVKDEKGNSLSSVKIYVDGQYTYHHAPEIFTFGEGRYCDDDKQIRCEFGEHTIRLEKNGFEDWEDVVTINSGFYKEVNPVMNLLDSGFSPTPTLVSTSVTTPTPTRKPTSTPTLKPSPTPTGEILGGEITPSPEEPKLTPMVLGETKINSVNLLPKILIGVGILLLVISGGFLLLPKIKRYNRGKNEEIPKIG